MTPAITLQIDLAAETIAQDTGAAAVVIMVLQDAHTLAVRHFSATGHGLSDRSLSFALSAAADVMNGTGRDVRAGVLTGH